MKGKFLFLLVIIFNFFYAFAQPYPPKIYPQNYFRNPLNIPLELSANFGAIRKEHFHMGLDIRTQQKENLPIYATADGYVCRIKIERFGYGRAIYIKHNNGYTTLYAHLNNFFDALHQFVIAKQYKDEKWEQDFELQPNQFVIKKGQFIAMSGNTGGSEAPHLHFELRDEKGYNINPQLTGLNIADNIAPKLQKLFYYDRNKSTYEQVPQAIVLRNNQVEVKSNKIGFGFMAEEMANKSHFKYGIAEAELWVNNNLQFAFNINDFSYDSTRYINALLDYRQWYNTDKKIYHLCKLPGNKLNIYFNNNDGIVELNDTTAKQIKIVVKDAAGNKSAIQFLVKRSLYNMDNESKKLADVSLVPNTVNNFQVKNITLLLDDKAMYDTVSFNINTISNANSASLVYQLPIDIPVHNYYAITIPLKKEVDIILKEKIIMVLKNKITTDIKVPIWNENNATANFKRFGNISLEVDTIAPKIETISWKNNFTFTTQKSFTIRVVDNFSELTKVSAYIDDKWILLNRKGNYLYYNFDDKFLAGIHQLKIIAEDEIGNFATENFTINKK